MTSIRKIPGSSHQQNDRELAQGLYDKSQYTEALELLKRYSLDEMDVPTRQSYMMALVPPEERNVMAGSANLGRGFGRMPSSAATGFLWAGSYTVAPWLLGGGLKLIYDFSIYFLFKNVEVPEETS